MFCGLEEPGINSLIHWFLELQLLCKFSIKHSVLWHTEVCRWAGFSFPNWYYEKNEPDCSVELLLMHQQNKVNETVGFFTVIYCTLKHFPQTSSGKSSLEYIHTMMGAQGGPSSKDTIIIIIIKSVIDTIVILTICITVTSNITSQ